MWRIIIFILMIAGLLSCKNEQADGRQNNYGVFSFEQQLTLPGTPDLVYDAITGDISEWWDHSFSESPLRFYIDPKPGGGFYEIFDESGNGVLHATVIYANRGKALRFDGPLGLSGKAVQMVTTYMFDAAGSDSTTLKVSVHVAGEVDEGLRETVKAVWHHFIFERFGPYMETVYQKSL
ncbi:MAG: hypothetical protein AB7T22_10305 [Calditrichaceae bacterium]